MHRLKNILISIFQIYSQIIFKKRVDVIFYYPQHFNRSNIGTNPYFDPLIMVCKENDIRYVVIEEPDGVSDKPHNINALKGDALFWTIIIFRKLLRTIFKFDYLKQEKYTAKFINIITFGKLKVNKYVTISGSMEHLFCFINKNGKVYDLQHGIIFSKHQGYFYKDGKIRDEHQVENLNFLVYGEGTYNAFYKNKVNSDIIANRIHIIGCPLENKDKTIHKSGNIIFYSLQYTSDDLWDKREFTRLFIDSLKSISKYNLPIEYKHHPRFDNSVDLQKECKEYNILEKRDRIEEIINRTKLHITYFSTTAFEFAAYGIPTYFLISDIVPDGKNIFYDEYEYPLYKDMTIREVIERLNNPIYRDEDAKIVKEWYNKFYKPFDKKAFLDTIKS
ncbi:MAG: hypothetical protein IKV14_02425 [Muribaculaceae bacterium]|nr:hypothetical protein [Muribaculaceae bacterium]